MGKMLDLIPEDAAIEIEKGEEYLESARLVGEFIRNLPLTAEQNDKLVYMLVEHSNIARVDAFRFAVRLCASIRDCCEERRGDTTIH